MRLVNIKIKNYRLLINADLKADISYKKDMRRKAMAVAGINMAGSLAYQKIAEKRANSVNTVPDTDRDSFEHQILSQELKDIGMINQEEYLACANRLQAEQKCGRIVVEGNVMAERVETEKKAPYSYLADESGMIEYNGVVFVCDNEHQALCLGDMTDEKNVLTIPLSEGGCLKVNRNNIGDLSRAISMFSPEDVNRILSAIEQDKVCTRRMFEIDEMKNSIGEAEVSGGSSNS